MDNPQISVIVCTLNRASLLETALESILHQTLPKAAFQILVIDNGSTDSTREVCASYSKKHPNIQYFYEQKSGVSYARNRGLVETKTDYLAFLDDDARAEPTWLAALLEAARKTPATCVSGPVFLEWEGGSRPSWLSEKYEPLLCRYDMGCSARFLEKSGYLLTTNVLFETKILRKIGGFNTALGRRRNVLLGGEDNEIYQRFFEAGHPVFYEPAARVFHNIPLMRQTRKYLLARLFWDGASQPLVDRVTSASLENVFYECRQCLKLLVEILKNLIFDCRQIWDSTLNFVHRLGRLRTYFLIAWNSRKK